LDEGAIGAARQDEFRNGAGNGGATPEGISGLGEIVEFFKAAGVKADQAKFRKYVAGWACSHAAGALGEEGAKHRGSKGLYPGARRAIHVIKGADGKKKTRGA